MNTRPPPRSNSLPAQELHPAPAYEVDLIAELVLFSASFMTPMRIRLASPAVLFVMLIASGSKAQSIKTEWTHSVGASSDDYLFTVQQTTDGGFIACGYSKSDDAVRHHPSGEDAYVVKFDASGNVQWQKCYGGSANEEAFQIIQTMDGGYAVAICTESNNDGDVPTHPLGARD